MVSHAFFKRVLFINVGGMLLYSVSNQSKMLFWFWLNDEFYSCCLILFEFNGFVCFDVYYRVLFKGVGFEGGKFVYFIGNSGDYFFDYWLCFTDS